MFILLIISLHFSCSLSAAAAAAPSPPLPSFSSPGAGPAAGLLVDPVDAVSEPCSESLRDPQNPESNMGSTFEDDESPFLGDPCCCCCCSSVVVVTVDILMPSIVNCASLL